VYVNKVEMALESDEDTLQQNGNEQSHDREKGGSEEKARSVGFWSNELSQVRLEVFKKWGITSTSCSVCLLYWPTVWS
jgi:hypothetical protein